MIGRGTPRQQRQPLPAVFGYITQPFAHQRGILQIVLRLDQFIESLLLPWPDQPHLNSVDNLLFRRRHLDLAFCFHAQSKTKTPALVPSFLLSLYPRAFYSSSRLCHTIRPLWRLATFS